MKKYTVKLRKNYLQFEKVTILAKDRQTALMIAKTMNKKEVSQG